MSSISLELLETEEGVVGTMGILSLEHENYTVGWVCALPEEMAAACAMLDEPYENPRLPSSDSNAYSLGRIGVHNVVIVCLPQGETGTNSAAIVATQMLSTFKSIKFGLLVGIGGGVPSQTNDIRLGDVVISKPTNGFGGVVQYDRGKTRPGSLFERTGSLNGPPSVLGAALAKMQSVHDMKDSKVPRYLSDMVKKCPKMFPQYTRQASLDDTLFEAGYEHIGGDNNTCSNCDTNKVINRSPRDGLVIHYGLIASGNRVMRDALERDQISKSYGGVLCFEMEAAGLVNNFPCVVIRGICDYADSHKNKQWQKYAAAVAAASAKELLGYISVSEVANIINYRVDFSMKGVPVVSKFVGRTSEINRLEKSLSPQNPDNGRKISVLHGLGGIGKTQLAVEFARRYHRQYDSVFWLDGRTEQSLKNSLTEVGKRLPQGQVLESVRKFTAGSDKLENITQHVLSWFSLPGNTRWLLIFDNVDRDPNLKDPDAYDIEKFIPEADHGSILITTRMLSLGDYGNPIEVKGVSQVEARSILSNRLRPPLQGLAGVSELLDLLGGLPLAISQAGAFITKTGSSISEYIQYYKKDWGNLMEPGEGFRDGLKEYPARSIITTWQITYDYIKQNDEAAAFLLELWAYLDPSDIWFDLFTSISEIDLSSWQHVPECFQRAIRNQLDFARVKQTLLAYSLVEQNTEEFSMHPVVHGWVYNWVLKSVDSTARSELVCLALKVVGDAVPMPHQRECQELQQKLLRHANRCVSCYTEMNPQHAGFESVYQRLGNSLNGLGMLYASQGKLKEAEEMYKWAQKGREEEFGSSHEFVFDTIQNLGSLYFEQGKPKEAEEMYKRALEGYKNVLRPDDLSILKPVSNLGILYSDQGKLREAKEMFKQALAGYKNALGPDDLLTLVTIKNLGILYSNHDKLERAERMFEQALAGYTTALGPHHISTLEIVNNLGTLYANQGKLRKAIEMYERALPGYKKAFGPTHTSTLDIANSMDTLYSKLNEAEEMCRRTQTSYEITLGHNQGLMPSVADTLIPLRDCRLAVPESSGFGEHRRGILRSSSDSAKQIEFPWTSPNLKRGNPERSLIEAQVKRSRNKKRRKTN